MHKLKKPLYHGTSRASAILIIGGHGFNAPVHLTENKQAAVHYAKAAAAYLEHSAQRDSKELIASGWVVFEFRSIPNEKYLRPDDYNPSAEPNQWKYTKRIRGSQHYTTQSGDLDVTEEERLRLQCFAIGMWRD